MKKKLVILLLALTLPLSGCSGHGSIYSNYREIEHLLPVQTLGLDASEFGVKLSVSCSKSGENSTGAIISRDGTTILRAMDSLQDFSAAGQLYYPHAQYVLLGEGYARAGIDEALDFLARDGRMRMGILLFVAKDESAAALITGPGQESYDISGALTSVRRDTSDQGTGEAFTCRETIRALSESGAALVCAVKSADTEGSVFLTESGKTAVADGYAVLKDGFLVDYLSVEMSTAASLLMGRSGTAATALSLPDVGEVSLKMDSAKAKIKPRWNGDGSLEHIDVSVKLTSSITEVRSRVQNITDPSILDALARMLEEDTKQKIEAVLGRSTELNADFLGLMAHLRQDRASYADALPDNWLESAVFDVRVEAEVKDAGDMGDIMNTDGWGK